MERTMTWLSSRAATLCAAAGLLLAAAPAGATLMRPLSVADLASDADVVIRGEVLRVDVVWAGTNPMPVTLVDLRVSEVLAGPPQGRRGPAPAPGQVLTLSQPGGVKDDVELDYAGRPRFQPGQETVVFLARRGAARFIPVGLAQGVFRIGPADSAGRRALTRDLDGVTFVEPAAGGGVPADLEGLRRALAALPRELGATP